MATKNYLKKMSNIELHIFTNATISAPSTEIIESTYHSFCNCFNLNLQPTVWYDPKPNVENSDKYLLNLKKIFPTINITTSLSDGYIQAVRNSKSDFLFMLEHDWKFLPSINHSLEEICELMAEDQLVHLRFNKRDNKPIRLDKRLEQVNSKIQYCLTPFLSNNPHIIQRKNYLERAFSYLKKETGSKGIEQRLKRVKSLKGAIYGPLNYIQTIEHLDGKKNG